jgi:hypothetical protein
VGVSLKDVVDFIRGPDLFKGKLSLGGKDIVFTPGEESTGLAPSVKGALAYWSGLQITFNYIVNVGDTLSVWTQFGHSPGGAIHWVDPSGLKGPQTQASYFDYLNFNHPGKVSRPEYNKPGKGIPDIMTTRKNRANQLQQYYEIKPDNPQGQRDGKDKLDRINTTLKRFSLESFYKEGKQKDIEPLSLKCFDGSCGAGHCEIFLEQRLQPAGLILYKFRLRLSLDPGPFITKAVIALAVVAIIEGGVGALSRAARQAAGGTAVNAAEEAALQKIREELLKTIAEHAGSEAVAEQVRELGSEGIIEHTAKKLILSQ